MTIQNHPTQDEWLPLSKAAEHLSVHPTTLRRWANNGDIPVMLTPGGHRRFSLAELKTFADEHHSPQLLEDVGALWASEAVGEARRQLSSHRDDNWLAPFDDEMRLRHRALGQQLMGLTLRYLSDDSNEAHLTSAIEIGHQYGQISLQAGIPLSGALRASIFFRDTLVETALHLPEHNDVKTDASLRLLRRINTLLNTVQLAIAEIYDATYSDSLSGP